MEITSNYYCYTGVAGECIINVYSCIFSLSEIFPPSIKRSQQFVYLLMNFARRTNDGNFFFLPTTNTRVELSEKLHVSLSRFLFIRNEYEIFTIMCNFNVFKKNSNKINNFIPVIFVTFKLVQVRVL